ncbi:14922_t:CDS:2 [Funneliformis geosporum]|uniref:14922_t:CDS:1 n=1 Tax=Funneliformis geosporum TaxID=1117311 RepID=A0A9W4T3B5_9GLOM|nr:14922_t:CDS:2 [Funneliformis geosporum]
MTRREISNRWNIRKGKVGNSFFSKNKNLTEDLKLVGFTNLRKLIISSHQITNLNLSNCPKLEEVDCHGNELTSLNVTHCSNLKKIDCSNNNLEELDLSTCTKLEEVDINNCSNLIQKAINSNLNYDVENGKLVKDSAKKSSPKIIKAKENDTRNILIVGITGNGKSALANALSSSVTNEFGEKNTSTSVTKSFQENTNNINETDILFKIGEGIHSAKEGINQVLFVFKGRLSPEHIVAFNVFKDFIAETGITKFTTLVRTNFVDFRNQKKCQEDKESLLAQSKKVSEIINSCNGIIYVDNPSTIIEEDSEDSEDEREEKKKEANGIVLMVNKYNEKKNQIEQSDSSTKEKELKQAKTEVAKEINQGIKVSVGAEVPGIGSFTAAIEHTKQIINW